MIYKYIVLLLFMAILGGCIDRYNPPAITSPNQYLVVDGFINSGEGPTTFKLSYTRNLIDTTKINYPDGQVFIEGKNSASIELTNAGNGVFTIEQLNLDPSELYRLYIILKDGVKYYSEYVEVKDTPEIDSVSWKHTNDGITIYVNTARCHKQNQILPMEP